MHIVIQSHALMAYVGTHRYTHKYNEYLKILIMSLASKPLSISAYVFCKNTMQIKNWSKYFI